MEPKVARGIVEIDGADIYYERRGEGPALLMIAGGWGDGTSYGPVADMLASDRTVLTYHRRGNTRSPERGPRRQFSVLRQAADAAAVITANGFPSASVFGSSSGALIALELVAAFPDVVDRAIAHEAPIITALPDRGEFLDWYDHLYAVSLQGEPQRAQTEFFGRLGLDMPARDSTEEPDATALREHRRGIERFMLEEMPVFTYYRPDYPRLKMSDTPLTLAAGRDSLDLHGPGKPVFYAHATQRVAEITGKELVEFPGNHLSYAAIPQAFVETLRSALPAVHA
ncbi:alpha/beta fold hydrolase [Nocardia alni]|uniref:alpha/beta fold hydrolase n=1 Tax=Nocardia alni TaxID=2815723 RepID=UPI001C226269|nr:alpha/beta hydrolase [Nocardia alni]